MKTTVDTYNNMNFKSIMLRESQSQKLHLYNILEKPKLQNKNQMDGCHELRVEEGK